MTANTYCPDIYKSMYLQPVNSAQVNVAPCCQAHPQTVDVKAVNFSINELCQPARLSAADRLQSIECFQGIISTLKSQINYNTSENWIQALEEIDQRRGTAWRQSLEVAKYYQQGTASC